MCVLQKKFLSCLLCRYVLYFYYKDLFIFTGIKITIQQHSTIPILCCDCQNSYNISNISLNLAFETEFYACQLANSLQIDGVLVLAAHKSIFECLFNWFTFNPNVCKSLLPTTTSDYQISASNYYIPTSNYYIPASNH